MIFSLIAATAMFIIGIESLYHNAANLREIDPDIKLAPSTEFLYNSVQKIKQSTR